jgi:uncharacterized protein YdhG (YjbR/CyaY superfamily)
MGKRTAPPKKNFRTVDAYMFSQPEATRRVLQRVRISIQKALPGVEEVISYQIPAYKLHGRTVLYFAGWKQHYSLYPATARIIAALHDELAPYEYNGKGTIRFPLTGPVPTELIAHIAKLRAKEVAEHENSKNRAR